MYNLLRGKYCEPDPIVRPPERRLTDEDVQVLFATARNLRPYPHRYVAVLSLLAESGFRAGAIENARLYDVWDVHHTKVLDVITLEEKNSKLRRIVPSPLLKEALETYMRKERILFTQDSEWLFPNLMHPQLRAKGLAAHVVARLVKASGIDGISPHAFRRYVVNRAMKSGKNLEQVSKWLGHAVSSTTSKYYWTDDVLSLDMHQLPKIGDIDSMILDATQKICDLFEHQETN